MIKANRQFNLRLADSELERLAELARRSGLDKSQVVKRLIAEASLNAEPVRFLKGGGDD